MAFRNPGLVPFLGTTSPSLRRELDRMLGEAFAGRDSGWLPAVDVRENEREITVECELPGMRAENVDVNIDNGVMTISGEKREVHEEEEKEGRFHLIERSYGAFHRSFQLPQGVDEEQIRADFENGLLRVRIPKGALPRPRRIEVAGSSERKQVSTGRSESEEGRKRVESGRQTGAGSAQKGGTGKNRSRIAAKGRRDD